MSRKEGKVRHKPWSNPSRRKARRSLIVRIFAVLALAVAPTAFIQGSASATDGTVINWTGQGSDNLPCSSGGHWVLTGQGITSAVANIGDESGEMVSHGNGSFSFDSSGPIDANTAASATYQGEAKNPQFVLSHCAEGNPPPPTDVCPNIPGDQSEVPPGMVKDEAGNCVTPPPPTDVCPNIPGDQSEVPPGMVVEDGQCILLGPPPEGDVCSNLPGSQQVIPPGYVDDGHGNCVKPVIPNPHPGVDVCSNLNGNQASVPAGLTAVNGECVASAVPHTGLGDTAKASSDSFSPSASQYAMAALMVLMLGAIGNFGVSRLREKIRQQ